MDPCRSSTLREAARLARPASDEPLVVVLVYAARDDANIALRSIDSIAHIIAHKLARICTSFGACGALLALAGISANI
jgi:hypothetical protein